MATVIVSGKPTMPVLAAGEIHRLAADGSAVAVDVAVDVEVAVGV